MKKTNFTQAGGFPLEEKTLDYMQNAYMQILMTLIGHFDLPDVGNFIITGCEISGTMITDGILYIDGDLCMFSTSTGDLTTKIAKIETIENAPFENGNNLPTYYDYTAMVNNNGVELSTFVRVPNVAEMVNQVVNWADINNKPQVVIDPADLTTTPPQLTVLQRIDLLEAMLKPIKNGDTPIFFNRPANQIPQGYAEWLPGRGVTLVGVDPTILNGNFVNPEFAPLTTGQIDPGRTGGSKDAVLVSHSHTVSNIGESRYGQNAGSPGAELHGSEGDSSDYHQVPNVTTSTVGVSGAGKNLQPYRTVLFIYWVGI